MPAVRPIELISPLVSQRSRSLLGKGGRIKELFWALAGRQIRITGHIGAISSSCARVRVTCVYVIQHCEWQPCSPDHHRIEYQSAFQQLLHCAAMFTEWERIGILACNVMTYIETAIAIIKRIRLTDYGPIAAARHITARLSGSVVETVSQGVIETCG